MMVVVMVVLGGTTGRLAGWLLHQSLKLVARGAAVVFGGKAGRVSFFGGVGADTGRRLWATEMQTGAEQSVWRSAVQYSGVQSE